MSDKQIALARLKDLRSEIDEALGVFFDGYNVPEQLDASRHGIDALQVLRDFSERPGKRVRGALCIVAYENFGGVNHKTAVNLAVAVELIQNCLLIIDDVMDRSSTRRGDKTVHEIYKESLANESHISDTTHLSNMIAINIGLLCQHMASEILSQLDEDPARILELSNIFHTNILATCFGQIEDLYNDILKDADEAAIVRILTLKNSYYTFINPLHTGAALAGEAAESEAAIKAYGVPAGIAFQLQDDIIGLFGSESTSGKSAMDDLKEGKVTLLIQHSLEHGDEGQRQLVTSALGDESVTSQQHAAVKKVVTDTGSLDYSKQRAQIYASEAKNALDDGVWQPDAKQFLSGLVDYITEREK